MDNCFSRFIQLENFPQRAFFNCGEIAVQLFWLNKNLLEISIRTRNNSAMMSQGETALVWKHMLEAQVRAYYFGDLAASYSKRKQIITFITFFLSSGAAATLIAQMPRCVPIALSAITALLTSYAIAFGLDRKSLTMSKLHAQCMHIAIEYEHLWNHWYEDTAEGNYKELLARGAQASETAALDAPYIQKRLDYWADQVYSQYT